MAPLALVPNSMEETVELALTNNRDLMKSKMDVEIARNDPNDNDGVFQINIFNLVSSF